MFKRAFHWKTAPVLTKTYSRTAQCYEDIIGRSWARTETFLFPVWSDTDRQWAQSTQEHKWRGRGWQTFLCSNWCYNKIHRLSRICFADVDPEVNVCRLRIKKWLMEPVWGWATQIFLIFYLFFWFFCKLYYKPKVKKIAYEEKSHG